MISIRPLEHLLLDRGLTKKALYTGANFSRPTMDKLTSGGNFTVDILDRICKYLDCRVEDVIEYIPDPEGEI